MGNIYAQTRLTNISTKMLSVQILSGAHKDTTLQLSAGQAVTLTGQVSYTVPKDRMKDLRVDRYS